MPEGELTRQPMTLEELIETQKHFDAAQGAEERFPKRASAARKKLKMGNYVYPEPNVFPDDREEPPKGKGYFTARQAQALFNQIFEITYHRVRFHAKASPEDQDDVTLSLNGETLTIQREKEVTIPSSFMEVARAARYQNFTHLPNEPRKTAWTIMIFPFDLIGPSTKEAFLKQRKEGTRRVKEHVARWGFDAAPMEGDDKDEAEIAFSDELFDDIDRQDAEADMLDLDA